MKDIYHPVERAFLSEWFGLEAPDTAGDAAQTESAGESDDAGFIRPLDIDSWAFSPIDHAVARLCLNGIQEKLPQWAAFSPDGPTIYGRHYEPEVERRIQAHPVLLFEINWACSGPGFSWPEFYYVTLLPGFNRCVVTGSVDSRDSYGILDFAIGHFSPEEDLAAGGLRVIEDYWRRVHGDRGEPFEDFFSEGLIDAETAWAAAERVWGTEESGEAS